MILLTIEACKYYGYKKEVIGVHLPNLLKPKPLSGLTEGVDYKFTSNYYCELCKKDYGSNYEYMLHNTLSRCQASE